MTIFYTKYSLDSRVIRNLFELFDLELNYPNGVGYTIIIITGRTAMDTETINTIGTWVIIIGFFGWVLYIVS